MEQMPFISPYHTARKSGRFWADRIGAGQTIINTAIIIIVVRVREYQMLSIYLPYLSKNQIRPSNPPINLPSLPQNSISHHSHLLFFTVILLLLYAKSETFTSCILSPLSYSVCMRWNRYQSPSSVRDERRLKGIYAVGR